jgi:branched-chain amino acid aminotransferase
VSLIWIDGQWYDRDPPRCRYSTVCHSATKVRSDAGLRRKVFRLEEHVDRLHDSARDLAHRASPEGGDGRVTEEGVRRGRLAEGYLRHIVTRGVGDLGLDPRKCARATVIIIFDTISLWPRERYEQGLTVLTAGTPMPHREALSPRVKSLNYLPHILAKVECGIHAQVDEVLMLDSAGYVAEASGMNLFIVKRGELRTPPAYAGILRGVTRDAILELAAAAGIRRARAAQPVRRLHGR